jgi:hypothetical protein
MRLEEFERRFDARWKEKYSLYDSAADHWTRKRVDDEARQHSRELLMEYARETQKVGISRHGKNKAQQLFDELEIDPSDLELNDISEEAQSDKLQKSRIMYIERKAGKLTGEARMGRVTYSKTGRTLYYGGFSFRHLVRGGYKCNYYCVETAEEYWISGCKQDGSDRLYGERVPITIDEDAREEYWTRIRNLPQHIEHRVV